MCVRLTYYQKDMKKYNEALSKVFRQNYDKHKANEASRTILEDMSGAGIF